ncbi:MAG: ferredoxin [Firmicutes bacterium]|nr:ferredoxin [Bacillota bacterium]
MKVSVDPDLCISCGLCISLCPDVFEWDGNDKSYATVDTVPSDQEDCVHEAVDSCPTEAIKEE